MKRILTPIAFSFAAIGASAQCTPDPLYVDSVFGVWPDTLENFADGIVGVFYSDTMNLIVPDNIQDIDPGIPFPIPIDSVQLLGIAGLPPGLNVICNSQTGAACTYLSTVLGCGVIEGTPTTAGSFPMTLDVRVWVVALGPQAIDTSFGGYEITITPFTGIATSDAPGLSGTRNSPNPFSGRTNIEFELLTAAPVTISVFNLVGEEMQRITQVGTPGTNKVVFDGSELGEGVYIYKVEAGAATFTGRMVLNR